MKSTEVKVGNSYQCRVSGNLVTVTVRAALGIDAALSRPQRKFTVLNHSTGRIIDVTARRLRPLPR